MNEEQAKAIGDAVVEWLYAHNKITEDAYGNMSEDDRVAIAQAVMEVANS